MQKLWQSFTDAGELTCIVIPEKEQESLRDLIRAREDALENQQRARHRLAAVLNEAGNTLWNGQKLVSGTYDMDQGTYDLRTTGIRWYWMNIDCALDEQNERLKKFQDKIEELATRSLTKTSPLSDGA